MSKQKFWKAVKRTDKRGVYKTGNISGSIETTFKVGETYKEEFIEKGGD